MKKKVYVVFGTRPEAIKLAPIILDLKKEKKIKCIVCVSAQHREMLDQVLEAFNIIPDIDLDLMSPNQSISSLTSKIIDKLDYYLKKDKPECVIVQGDTTTVLSAAISSFYNKTPVIHVEAGLRTFDINSPWPEEGNRALTSRISAIHFAPTIQSQENLINEGIDKQNIFVTGNSVIPALFLATDIVKKTPPQIPGLDEEFLKRLETKKSILITTHRRENFGDGFESICKAILELSNLYKDVFFIFPVHLNPNVREPVNRILDGNKNIILLEPLSYLPFVRLMNLSKIILTDSGGIQEEAPSLGKPVLVMRDKTERPEAVKAGTVKLVGSNKNNIVNETSKLMSSSKHYNSMSFSHNPYGDKDTVKKMIKILKSFLEI
jgi:UDP-N-acetylglucosamine 2-epimerase (non-hydrolysing)